MYFDDYKFSFSLAILYRALKLLKFIEPSKVEREPMCLFCE